MKNFIVPGIIIGGLIAFLMAKKKALENIMLQIIDIGINSKKSNIKELVFNVRFMAENLENVPVTVKKINITLYANNSPISTYKKDTSLTVLPQENKDFFVEMKLNNITAVSTIITAIAAGKAPELNVKGTVTTDLGNITINS